MTNTIIIGGGAAGLMAGGAISSCGKTVEIVEKMSKTGIKLGITGKGRCNVTNNCTENEFLSNVVNNGRFLSSAIYNFPPAETISLFESLGVELKTERGNRVFPVSDKASDIVNALRRYSSDCKIVNATAKHIIVKDGRAVGISTDKGDMFAENIIIATGGASYPQTGSTGDGYRMAREVGHTVKPIAPSLVPIETEESWVKDLQGLSLKNVRVTLCDENGKEVYDDFGEMLFTHFGLSGPCILSMSSHMRSGCGYRIKINLKPALDDKTLDARILSDFAKYSNRDFINALSDLLPSKLIPVIVGLSGIDGRKKVNSVTKAERTALVDLLHSLPLTFRCFRPVSEAIVTSGGIETKEINPKTMESKLITHLYFAGEVIDVDAYTGGFNLQIAFATANAAAKAITDEE